MVSPTMLQDKCPSIKFGKVAVEDRDASIKAGRRITKDVTVVYVKQIGEKDEIECVADDYLKKLEKYAYGDNGQAPSIPIEWYERALKSREKFDKGFADQPDGFPVREWAVLTPSQVENMHSMATYTVEQVAQWSEAALSQYGMGARELRDKARTWLESGDDKAEKILALQTDNAAKAARIEKLEKDVAALMAQSKDEDSPRRGRKEQA